MFVFGMSSCKKDYTCTCRQAGQDDVIYPLGKVKKSQAESACAAWELGNPGAECSL